MKDKPVPIVLVRMCAEVLGGLLILPAGITKMPIFADLSSAILLFSVLLMTDSVRHRRSVAAILPPLVCLGPSTLVGLISISAGWHWAAKIAGASAVLCVVQLVYNWPQSNRKTREDVAKALAQVEKEPGDEAAK